METNETTGSDQVDLMSLFETLRRQAGLILATIAFCLGLAAIYLFAVTPTYTASSLVLVDPSPKNLLDPTAGGAPNQAFANARVDSEVEIMRSDTVALRVVRDQNLVNDPEFGPRLGLIGKIKAAVGLGGSADYDPKAALRELVKKFKAATQVHRKGQTFLISVSVASRSPTHAADLANALSRAYIAHQVETKIKASLAARDTLKSQIDELRNNLANSEQALDQFISENITRIETETGRTDIGDLERVLKDIKASRLQREVQVQQLQGDLNAGNWQALADRLQDDVVANLERQRAGVLARLGKVEKGSQAYVDLKAEIASLEEKLAQESKQALGNLRLQVNDLSTQEEETRRQLRETLVAGKLPADLLARIFEIQQDASNARSQYQNLLARMRDVETQAGIQIADSRLVSEALPPTAPSYPRKTLVVVLALMLGAGLGVFLAILKEFFIGGFTSEEQLQEAIGAPVAAAIPLVGALEPGEFSPADKVINAPLSAYSEAIRRLRATIDRMVAQGGATKGNGQGAKKGSPVILVTSTMPNEGKTTTALALARTYAQAGKTVVLIDSDLRKPSLHAFIGAEPSSGFLEYLFDTENKITMKHFLSEDPLSGATLALGRTRSAIPTDQLLLSQRFESVVSAARDTFDMVILDSPPLLPVIDAVYLAKYADAAVMVVRWGATTQKDVRNTSRQLREAMPADAHLIGVLSHQEGKRRRGYAYQYGYGDANE